MVVNRMHSYDIRQFQLWGGRMKYGIPVPVTAMCGFSDETIVKPPVLPQG